MLRVLDISNTTDLIVCLRSAVQTSRSPIIAEEFYVTSESQTKERNVSLSSPVFLTATCPNWQYLTQGIFELFLKLANVSF